MKDIIKTLHQQTVSIEKSVYSHCKESDTDIDTILITSKDIINMDKPKTLLYRLLIYLNILPYLKSNGY